MSTNPRIYLDYNASSPVVAPAHAAMVAALMDVRGNPSSVHAEGRHSRDLVERARNQVAALVQRPREQVVFTSGGTEANARGIATLAADIERRGGPRVAAAAALDHPSLRGAIAGLAARGWKLRPIGVSAAGALLDASLDGVGLVAISAVNHELGTLANVAAWSTRARASGALVYVDAVQLAGKRSFDLEVDAFTISAHKLGGPQGVGALITQIDAAADDTADDAADDTGHQERGRRAGTENVVGIVGFGAAAAAVDLAAWPRVTALGARLEAGLAGLGATINGAAASRVGGTINAGFAPARGESIVIALDIAGIAVSTGAACTSGSTKPSEVLRALGQSAADARGAVRFSLGAPTTAAEIERVLAVLPGILARARLTRP